MLQHVASSCAAAPAARADGFLRAELAQVVQTAMRSMQQTHGDDELVPEPDAKEAVAEAFCSLLRAGAAAMARRGAAARSARAVPNEQYDHEMAIEEGGA